MRRIVLLLLALAIFPSSGFAHPGLHEPVPSWIRMEDRPTTAAVELSPLALAFDAERAFRDLERQVGFGPRIPDQPGHLMTRRFIQRELLRAGFEVEESAVGPISNKLLGRDDLVAYNIIGRWGMDRPRRLFFSAHYDTRSISDMGETPEERATPIPGANDGGSGVAALLEMARAIAAHPPENVGVILVFHDLEDFGQADPRSVPGDPFGQWAQGAQLQAAAWAEEDHFEAGVNLDMVAGEAAVFLRERFSHEAEPELTAEFWALGNAIWPNLFPQDLQGYVIDDHVPYLRRGQSVINVIDMSYPEWHTPWDLPEACSPETLKMVGMTALEFLHRRDRGGEEKP